MVFGGAEMSEFGYEELESSPLIPGATYKGGNSGNIGDEPISKLLPVGNAGGFRPIGATSDCRFVALVSTGNKNLWPDAISDGGETYVYYGDNDRPGVNPLDTPRKGNALLKRAFELSYGIADQRRKSPIFLIFHKTGLSRDFQFLGFALAGAPKLPLSTALTEVSVETEDGQIRNYKATLTVITDWELSRVQLDEWIKQPDDLSNAPEGYLTWINRGWGSITDSPADAIPSKIINESVRKNQEISEMIPSETLDPVDKELSIRPDASMLAILENISYKEWFALGELIDNAISSYREDFDKDPNKKDREPLEISIDWDSAASTITVKDNARGIPLGPNGWDRVFELGRKKTDARYLSVFGYGMKAAGLWWSPKIRVSSTVEGEPFIRWAVLDRELAQTSDTTPLRSHPADPKSHGTEVTLLGINRNRSIPAGGTHTRIKSYLESMYRVYLRGGEPDYCLPDGTPWLTIKVQGAVLVAPNLELLKQPYWDSVNGPQQGAPEKLWKTPQLNIEVGKHPDGSPKKITGWVGILEKGRPNDAGFLMLYRGKGVVGVGQSTRSSADLYRPKEIVGSGNSNRRQRFVGEFDVSELGKSITTDDMFWSDDEESTFVSELEKLLKEHQLWQMAENWRPTKLAEMQETAVNSYEDAADDVVRAVEQDFEREKTFSAEVNSESDIHAKTNVVVTETFNKTFIKDDITYQFVGALKNVKDDWLSVYDKKIQINLNHPFMQSYFYVPGHNPRGIFSVAMAIALAEIETGEAAPRQSMNELLNGPLGQSSWETEEIE